MAIIMTASEPIHFEKIAGSLFDTTTTALYRDTRLSRCAIWLDAGDGRVGHAKFHSTTTEVWLHFVSRLQDARNYTDRVHNIYDTSSSTVVACLKRDGYSGNTQHMIVEVGGVEVAGTEFDIQDGVLNTFDWYFKLGVAGVIKIYINDSLVVDYTGDTSVAGVTDFDAYRLAEPGHYDEYISEIFADNSESTIGKRLATCPPNTSGNHSDWTGAYTDIDEIDDGTVGDYITSDTVSEVSTFGFQNIHGDFSSYNIDALEVFSHDRITGTSAIADLQHVIRTGGSDYTSANLSITKDNSLQMKKTLHLTNPDTTNAWTRTEYDGAEFGIKAV